MDSPQEYHTARVLLEWQMELGATEAIGDEPVNRYGLDVPSGREGAAPGQPGQLGQPAQPAGTADPVAAARASAAGAQTLDTLRDALAGYDHCELKRGARNLVFSDGVPGSRVMIIGEAPGRDEDREGRPFVGRAGQMLDRMLGAIGLSRARDVYIANVLPWRPPRNRDPRPDEIAMLLPFLARHVELAAPALIVPVGNISCQACLGRRGITRLRGQWTQAFDRPALPMFHPAYLLRQPLAKREAWADLLELHARMKEIT